MSIDQMRSAVCSSSGTSGWGRTPGAVRKAASDMGLDVFFDWDSARSVEGYFRIKGSTEFCIERAIAFAPYADCIWMETGKPILAQATQFAQEVRAAVPHQMLAYNLSPSFNWDSAGMTDAQMESFIWDLVSWSQTAVLALTMRFRHLLSSIVGAMTEDSKQRAAYSGRQSTSTRNPHTASKAIDVKSLSKLSVEDRVFAQWRAASGCPISDEAKTQFCIQCLGKTFNLADVRLWQHAPGKGNASIYLEFFFDGSPDEIRDQEEVFKKAFESMIETQLQEQRLTQFRQKLAARRRKGQEGEGEGDQEWQSYLKRPVPATELSIRSIREAGCMLRFLVCQTSISTGAAEVLGQIAFQEHFPIDGVAQEPSKSMKPMPRWVYGLGACTAFMTVVTITAWYQVVRQISFSGAEATLG
eukprot:Skav234905  [mRNA]  locus=scaffold840:771493:775069:+ [translate_table: standard]